VRLRSIASDLPQPIPDLPESGPGDLMEDPPVAQTSVGQNGTEHGTIPRLHKAVTPMLRGRVEIDNPLQEVSSLPDLANRIDKRIPGIFESSGTPASGFGLDRLRFLPFLRGMLLGESDQERQSLIGHGTDSTQSQGGEFLSPEGSPGLRFRFEQFDEFGDGKHGIRPLVSEALHGEIQALRLSRSE
jgi:hypothetical protein